MKLTARPLSRRGLIKGAGVLAAGVAAPAFLRIRSGFAAYPERIVKVVVANTPGGPSDIVGRLVTAALQQSTGKVFVIENRGGAGGNIGMEYAARAEADGYTFLLATNAYSVNPGLYTRIPYDPYKDFVAVSELATSPNTFVVKSELPAKTIRDFVALARGAPEKYNCATPPIGTTAQIQLEVFKLHENLPNLEDLVFKGAATPSRRCSAGRRSSARARCRPPRRTSRRGRAGALRSPATRAGPIWRTCRPCRNRAIRTSCSRPTRC
jgi:tripartite-type tricarboxylate transporter receptor subunit TctC